MADISGNQDEPVADGDRSEKCKGDTIPISEFPDFEKGEWVLCPEFISPNLFPEFIFLIYLLGKEEIQTFYFSNTRQEVEQKKGEHLEEHIPAAAKGSRL